MQSIIEKMGKGHDVPQDELQKIVGKLVRFFKKRGFSDVSQDTRKSSHRYFLLRIKGDVSNEDFSEASKICPATKTHVQQPDGILRQNAWSYFIV